MNVGDTRETSKARGSGLACRGEGSAGTAPGHRSRQRPCHLLESPQRGEFHPGKGLSREKSLPPLSGSTGARPVIMTSDAPPNKLGEFLKARRAELSPRTNSLLAEPAQRAGGVWRRIPDAAWNRAETLMTRRGGRAVLLARFLPPVRGYAAATSLRRVLTIGQRSALQDERRLPVRRRGRPAAEQVGEPASTEQPGEVGPVLLVRGGGHRREGRDLRHVGGGAAESAGESRVMTAQ